MTPKYLAVLLFAHPSVHASTPFTILDHYTARVPTGTSYQQLTYYTQYVDAGSVDASPFVIDLLTSPRQNNTGILFYGSTELISKSQANTFRLSSTTGLFDFTSFYLQDLEPYHDEATATTIPEITISSSTGFSQTFSATVESEEMFPGFFDYSYTFFDTGVKEMNWSGVEWVDFTTHHTKAKTSDFVLATNISMVPEPSSLVIGGLLALRLMTRCRRVQMPACAVAR